jgi:aminoglycoside/choline kinase family phosphotransferase
VSFRSEGAGEREAPIRRFLNDAGLGAARRAPLPGDASTRRYERLHLADGRTLMLMDAPPTAESRPCGPRAGVEERKQAGYNAMARLSAGRVDAFVAASGYLRQRGLSAPAVVAADVGRGLAVLEDLGDDLFTDQISRGAEPRELYFTAVEALAQLHAETPHGNARPRGRGWPCSTMTNWR